MSRALWDTCRSGYFSMSNGVKQGGVLSVILFTINIDKLLCKLKRSGLGCRMGNSYVGALSYADDITLLCPSIRGLNKMLDIWVIPCQITQCLKRYPLRFWSKFIHLVYVTRIDDPYNLRSFGKIFSELLTLKKCQIGVFWAQPP